MIARFAAASFALALIAGCAPLVSGPDARDAVTAPEVQSASVPDAAAAGTYCKSTGGQVQRRRPVSGTNDSSSKQELALSGSALFCMYASKNGKTRIYTMLGTLYATKPTLAALAYYHAPKVPKTCVGDPSSCYCSYVGGSDRFDDVGVAEGAWVLEGAADVNLQACVFPDLSSIDSWGLTYHAEKIVSGIDLTKVLRYHPK